MKKVLDTPGGWLLVCLGIALLASAARLYHVPGPVLWLDEAYSVTIAGMSPSQILFHTIRDVHPPFYYLLLHYWIELFGNGLLAVRGLSVLCSSLSVTVAMLIAVQLANRRAALLVGVLFALLPISVRYGQETRM
ncbi:glycosyltransferase family 39 protein [Pseudomonas carassii]|uniref:Glycosyltransferase family 39 protein n=1 Tax=Pseudomonas carassii TaxID=3115855 RepID=A0ABU7H6Q2_9PSED|nr:glycosyltransferase family 39 protein [Pseudomonas sp. 137P]MEE1886965.1 glycosyltransferase family 39 protein [Pseudomonas sp. 137P]